LVIKVIIGIKKVKVNNNGKVESLLGDIFLILGVNGILFLEFMEML
jgi:hypothetical protein